MSVCVCVVCIRTIQPSHLAADHPLGGEGSWGEGAVCLSLLKHKCLYLIRG